MLSVESQKPVKALEMSEMPPLTDDSDSVSDENMSSNSSVESLKRQLSAASIKRRQLADAMDTDDVVVISKDMLQESGEKEMPSVAKNKAGKQKRKSRK